MSPIEIGLHQVWHDRDRRALSGNRHVTIVNFGTKVVRRNVNGFQSSVNVDTAICRPSLSDGTFISDRLTVISLETLRKRFELVPKKTFDPYAHEASPASYHPDCERCNCDRCGTTGTVTCNDGPLRGAAPCICKPHNHETAA